MGAYQDIGETVSGLLNGANTLVQSTTKVIASEDKGVAGICIKTCELANNELDYSVQEGRRKGELKLRRLDMEIEREIWDLEAEEAEHAKARDKRAKSKQATK